MVATSITERVAFTPAWREGDDSAPVFYLRAGSVIERAQMEAELAGVYRAGRVYGFELRQAIEDGIVALLDGDEDQAMLLELLAAEAAGEAAPIGDNARTVLERAREILAEHWPPYRGLLAQVERRRELAPIVALRWFCVDIVAPGVTFARGRDTMVDDATLAALDPLEMIAAGNRAFSLQYMSEEDQGNSPRPSPSDDGQQTSNSDAPSKAAGTSKGRSGKKTPGSSSRRGPGRSSTSTSSPRATRAR